MADRILPDAYAELLDYAETTATFASCRSLLGWDQATYMPPGGAELRGRQLALLAGTIHRRRAAPRFLELIEAASRELEDEDPDAPAAANVREWRRDHERAARLPTGLVEEKARATALARVAWIEARRDDDFERFRPWLERMFDLCRREADALGYVDHPLDALLDFYEPDETAARLDALFGPLREELTSLLDRIRGAGPMRVDTSWLDRPLPRSAQEECARLALEAIGFDLERGRLDPTVHPFCSSLGPDDVRITTRYEGEFFRDGFLSVLHEADHGLYEQGLDGRQFGTPMGQACSTGVHESQSRLWENAVGRSRGFWRHFLPRAREACGAVLEDCDPETCHRSLHEVRPNFIRVDADEVTYNLHIILRFDLERALLRGELEARDLPGAWSETHERLFGLRPPDDRRGCLQDVHWSIGLVGYFPTYTLGNVYAAQIFEQVRRDLGDPEEAWARGEFRPLRDWLSERIHRQGRRYPPRRLLERVTGRQPSPEPLLRALTARYGEVYGL
jgi:carboxypeptidase Taq